MSDEDLKKLVGQPYTEENARKMVFGGRINSKGIIVKVVTKSEKKKLAKRCKPFFFF